MSLEGMVADSEMEFRGLTRTEYETLVEAGAMDHERIELLEGGLFWMAPQGPMHAGFVEQLANALTLRLHDAWPGRYRVRQRLPLAVSEQSEPEPDICVVETSGRSAMTHPSSSPLVVEVAFSSQSRDLVHKPRLYAGGGFPEFWVVDLPWQEVVVHRSPRSGPLPTYASVNRLPFGTPVSVLDITLRLSDFVD